MKNSTKLQLSLYELQLTTLKEISNINNFFDKKTYLEEVYSDIVKNTFTNEPYIFELFKLKFNDRIILESTFDFKKNIKEINKFILKAHKFKQLREQYASSNKTPQSVLGINQGSQSSSPNFKSVYQSSSIGRFIPAYQKKVSPKKEFFEKLREHLESGGWMVTSIVMGLFGPYGEVAASIPTVTLFIHDLWKYFIDGVKTYLGKILADYIGLIMNLIKLPDELATAASNYIKKLNRSAASTIFDLLKDLNEGPIGQFLASVLSWVVSGIQIVIQNVKTGIEWVSQNFGWDKGKMTGLINSLNNIMTDLKNAASKLGLNINMPVSSNTSGLGRREPLPQRDNNGNLKLAVTG